MKLIRVKNENGPDLVYSTNSGVKIIEKDKLKFKNHAKDGTIHPYEDWRLDADQRAKDLAERLDLKQLVGLMLYSKHQFIPGYSNPYFGEVTYENKSYENSGCKPYELTDQQKVFIVEDGVRHILLASVSGTTDAVTWSNKIQELAETQEFGIPVNICSDPRHGIDTSTEFNVGAGGGTSQWPENIGLAATFDPCLVEKFGEIASKEYRALGISTTLSPQCDLTTDPRWFRFSGSFSEDSLLSTELTRAYCDGFQTSKDDMEIRDGWGYDSVNTMVKHWPGGACGEGGRDAHFGNGKYEVYPGNNFSYHLKPFVEGAFELNGKTKKASAVMPYYSVAFDQDSKYGENVGSGFSKYLINDLLRNKYQYDEVVCTDWNIIFDQKELDSLLSGKCWGVEHLSIAERCLKIIMAGVDQFGGLSDMAPILDAYKLGSSLYGEDFMRKRFEKSAYRILKNIFRVGLFENPYLNTNYSEKIVGKKEYIESGYNAQRKSLILLKNKNKVLPLARQTKVYIPKRYNPPTKDWVGNQIEGKWERPKDYLKISNFFTIVDDLEKADVAICFIQMPGLSEMMRGYNREDLNSGGNGYLPISLQYRPYSAVNSRQSSIAGGDPQEKFLNRSYHGKYTKTKNEMDYKMVLEMKEVFKNKPVITVIQASGPMVINEIEQYTDAIIYDLNGNILPVLDLISGEFEPSGLLPLQIPKSMDEVELQFEDVPFDMHCHTDTEGNTYDYTFGLNWSGKIEDERVKKYQYKNRK